MFLMIKKFMALWLVLEKAMKADDREHVAPSMCYAYAALTEGAPFIMGAPNTTVDIPAMWELAEKVKMPIAGKISRQDRPW
jgi:myo-inositol-1-phosphate synthase